MCALGGGVEPVELVAGRRHELVAGRGRERAQGTAEHPVPPLTNSRIRDGGRGWWARGVDRALAVMAASGRPAAGAGAGRAPGQGLSHP